MKKPIRVKPPKVKLSPLGLGVVITAFILTSLIFAMGAYFLIAGLIDVASSMDAGISAGGVVSLVAGGISLLASFVLLAVSISVLTYLKRGTTGNKQGDPPLF